MRRRFNATTAEEIGNGSKKKKISYNNEQNSAYISVKFFLFDGNFKLSIFHDIIFSIKYYSIACTLLAINIYY